MANTLSHAERKDLRKEILIAIVGIGIGALSTVFTKFVESEFAYQASLKVIEYDDSCAEVSLDNSAHGLRCTLKVEAKGRKTIKGTRLTMIAFPNPADPMRRQPSVRLRSLAWWPESSPPSPSPQIVTDANQTSSMSVVLDRLIEPQVFTWVVDVRSPAGLDEKQVQRSITIQDDDARAENGSSWRWRRWTVTCIMAFGGVTLIGCLALLTLWILR